MLGNSYFTMKGLISGLIAAFCLSGTVVAAEGDFVQFQRVLDNNCSKCHTRTRIEEAMRTGANREEIVQKMIRFGARLTSREQQVLGIFWETSEESKSAPEPTDGTVAADPLGEFRAVLESRCVGCHSLERVEAAMMQGRSIDDLIEMMRKRGAIVTPADKEVLGTFWGEPLKDKSK